MNINVILHFVINIDFNSNFEDFFYLKITLSLSHTLNN